MWRRALKSAQSRQVLNRSASFPPVVSSYWLSLKSLYSLLTSPSAFFLSSPLFFFFFLHQRCLWARAASADPLLSLQSRSSGIAMSHSAVSLSAKRRLTFLQTLQTRFFHPPPTAPSFLLPPSRAAWLRCSKAAAAAGRRKLVISQLPIFIGCEPSNARHQSEGDAPRRHGHAANCCFSLEDTWLLSRPTECDVTAE